MLRLILNCRKLRQDPTQHVECSTGTTQKAPKGMEMSGSLLPKAIEVAWGGRTTCQWVERWEPVEFSNKD